MFGFSGKRVGLVLACISFGLIPFQFYVSCQLSEALAEIGFVIFCATGILSFICPQGTTHRFRAVALAFIGSSMFVMGNNWSGLFVHGGHWRPGCRTGGGSQAQFRRKEQEMAFNVESQMGLYSLGRAYGAHRPRKGPRKPHESLRLSRRTIEIAHMIANELVIETRYYPL